MSEHEEATATAAPAAGKGSEAGASGTAPKRAQTGSRSGGDGSTPGGNGESEGEGAGDGGSGATGGGGAGGARTAGSGARRRRGRRGGRRHRKPGTGAPAPAAADAAGEDERGGDWTDEAADRGLTSEDLAVEALEEAGLRPAPPGAPARPKIGDSRPAPKPRIGDSRPAPAAPAPATSAEGDAAAPATPAKRRRRRGGRGRSKKPAGTGSVAPVEADLGATDVDGTAILESLDDETLQRRRGSRRKGRPAGRYLMVAHRRPDGTVHLAVLEGRALIEHYVSRPTDDVWSIDGNLYLGRVQNVLPGMEAAFIDIGTPKNAVLYRGDVVYDPSEVEGGEKPRIERVLRNGQSIIVQVTKNPIGHKGARLTQEVSLAGRFVVMVPSQPQTYGISKRLPDDERRRLRRILDRLRPADAGLIVRTAAEGATEDELERDMRRLQNQWQQVSELARKAKPGSLLYKEPPLVVRIIREEFTKEYRAIVTDDRDLYEEVRSYVEAVAPELVERVEYHDPVEEGLPVFERFHVHEQLHKALDKKVWLPSGGSIVIERTEALTVIDVNTGKNVGSSNLEETVFRNNLEAADVIARELRLRDIGGIIVVDFIDMEPKANREAVEEAFREALARDKTRTQTFSISELGLLEMTRKRVSEGLVEEFAETCPHCEGRGFLLDLSMLD